MSDERLDNLTKQHARTLEMLNEQTAAGRRNRNYLIVTALTALVGGSGSATALIGNDDENVKTAVATHVAVYQEWKPEVSDDIETMQIQIIKMREAMIRLQVTVEGLSGDDATFKARLNEVEGLLDEAEGFEPPPRPRGMSREERVQKLKGSLFEE